MNRLAPIGRLTLGAAISLSLPPYGLWMLTPIGLGLHLRLSQASTKRRQLLNTFSLWVGYYGVALVWMTDLTVAGWLVAIPVQAVIMSAPMALVPDSGTGRSIAFPAALVVAEAIRWVLPFGGVPIELEARLSLINGGQPMPSSQIVSFEPPRQSNPGVPRNPP
ncbi:MAG: hypothetical protein ACPHIZ_08265, partial [Acidimicrobiales bacterium]